MRTRSTTGIVKFRRSASLSVAAGIATIGTIPLLAESLWFLPLMVVPLGFGVWVWRAGTDVSKAGFTVRALLGKRHFPWAVVDGLVVQDGTVQARLANGSFVKLDAVSPLDIDVIKAETAPKEAETEPEETEPEEARSDEARSDEDQPQESTAAQ